MISLWNQSRKRIIEFLKENGFSKVIELARLFTVAKVMVRRNLEIQGLIIREHGGAFLKITIRND